LLSGARSMAANVNPRGVSVFPVGPSRQFAGPKRSLAEVARLPSFRPSPARSWNQEYLHNQALGDKNWFLRSTSIPVTILWYRENGGIPYDAVAVRPRNTPLSPVVLASDGLVHASKPPVSRHARPVASMPTTVLSPPETEEFAERMSWWEQFAHGPSGDATTSLLARLASLGDSLRSWLGYYTTR